MQEQARLRRQEDVQQGRRQVHPELVHLDNRVGAAGAWGRRLGQHRLRQAGLRDPKGISGRARPHLLLPRCLARQCVQGG